MKFIKRMNDLKSYDECVAFSRQIYMNSELIVSNMKSLGPVSLFQFYLLESCCMTRSKLRIRNEQNIQIQGLRGGRGHC